MTRLLSASFGSTGLAALLASAAYAQVPEAPPPPVTIPDYQPVTQETLENPAPGDWPFYRRTYDGWGYSPLEEVNKENVSDLQPVWMISTGHPEGHEAPPQVVNGVMFVSTAGNQVLAVEAATGDILWRYRRELPPDMLGSHPTNRGVGLWDDKVFFISRDSVLVALDAKSGAEVWTATMEDYRRGYYSNLAPLVVDGKVLVGTSGGERGVRGYIAAYDAESGDEVWRTFMIPEPGEPGAETWDCEAVDNPDCWQTGGASTWITGHYDPETRLTYWGTGNGGPWAGDQRPGDNLYVTSVVAMDIDSGEIKGHFQYLQNESWDWDEVAAPILVDLPNGDGEDVPGLVHAARSGILWKLERTPDGPINFISGDSYVYTDWIESMDENGRVTVAEGKKPGTGVLGQFCPSFWGGKDWPPIAYSPDTNFVYIPANENMCSDLQMGEVTYIPGAAFTRGDQGAVLEVYMRDEDAPLGEMQAWDLASGELVWKQEFESHNWGPLMVTAGGLVFGGGTNDRMFRAFDAESGEILWETRLNSGVIGVPSTFEVDGKQYVSVVAGWGIDAQGMQNRLSARYPDKFEPISAMPVGGVIWTFALP
jgi:alcohol dehydrogenase (cytochrome c)